MATATMLSALQELLARQVRAWHLLKVRSCFPSSALIQHWLYCAGYEPGMVHNGVQPAIPGVVAGQEFCY
ncbi:hypothetical protein AB0154_26210, partial [Klebsiella pneumoniae]